MSCTSLSSVDTLAAGLVWFDSLPFGGSKGDLPVF